VVCAIRWVLQEKQIPHPSGIGNEETTTGRKPMSQYTAFQIFTKILLNVSGNQKVFPISLSATDQPDFQVT
jgi:hypothetical protein